jgi:hypothetical protein
MVTERVGRSRHCPSCWHGLDGSDFQMRTTDASPERDQSTANKLWRNYRGCTTRMLSHSYRGFSDHVDRSCYHRDSDAVPMSCRAQV